MKRILLAILFLLGARSASAATYYISPTGGSPAGSDARNCTVAQTASTPKATFASAITCMTGADTLLVYEGTYDAALGTFPSGTSWTNKARIANVPGNNVLVRPSAAGFGGRIWWIHNVQYLEIDGINFDATDVGSETSGVIVIDNETDGEGNTHHIRVQNLSIFGGTMRANGSITTNADDCEFINLTIHGGGLPTENCVEPNQYLCNQYAFYISSKRNLIQGNDLYDTSGAAIQLYNNNSIHPGFVAEDNVIRNNRIHDITRAGNPGHMWGILVAGDRNHIYNNLFYNIYNPDGFDSDGLGAVTIGNNQADNAVYNNTIYNVKRNGIAIGSNTTNTTIRNNLVFDTVGAAFYNFGAISYTETTNMFSNVDPEFVDVGSGNFRVLVTSDAVNAGTTVAEVTIDFYNTPRPQGGAYDIGAYEYGADTPIVPVTIYTAKTGSDSNSCADAQSQSTPKLTVNAGISCLTPVGGSILYVKVGSYGEAIAVNAIPSGTSWDEKILISKFGTDVVTLNPSTGAATAAFGTTIISFGGIQRYIEINGINLNSTASTTIDSNVYVEGSDVSHNANHIRLTGFTSTIGSNQFKNIYLDGAFSGVVGDNEVQNLTLTGVGSSVESSMVSAFSPNNLIEHNNISSFSGGGIVLLGGGGSWTSNNTIRYNKVRDSSQASNIGIILWGGTNNLAFNNLVYNLTGTNNGGIEVYDADNSKIYNNTIYNINGTGSFGIRIDDSGSDGTQVKNNIAYTTTTAFIDNGTGLGLSMNLFATNPLFVNIGTADFHLTSLSTAINGGVTLADVPDDYDGVLRPQSTLYDIGAYEFDGVITPPSVSVPSRLRIKP